MMAGGDCNTGAMATEGMAEVQYVNAKTSVWWDIENCHVPKVCDTHAIAQNISSALIKMNYCGPISISAYGDTNRIPASVQHALSSTGIALNHVPAGVKDASDKKILVDMLFWAVDNPAPANYLLISGDRDFSNALHQLRMRRYNILLAQPQKASAPLIAAAKSVWLWTSLLTGGIPQMTGDTLPPSSHSNNFHLDSSQQPVSEPNLFSQSTTFNPENIVLGNQMLFTTGGTGNIKYQGKYTSKPLNQPSMVRFPSGSVAGQQNKEDGDSHQSEHTQVKQFKKAPHEFFGARNTLVATTSSAPSSFSGNPDQSVSSVNFAGNPHSVGQKNGPRHPTFPPGNSSPSNFHNHCFHNPLNSHEANAEDFKKSTIYPSNPASLTVPKKGNIVQSGPYSCHDNPDNRCRLHPVFPFPSTSQANITHSGTWGSKGLPQTSEYVQSLIGVIILALNTLKTEKVMPTEANITDCIQHEDLNPQNADVKKALDCAVEHNMVMKKSLGYIHFYVRKNENLWKCVNPISGSPDEYQKATWDRLQNFIASSDGRSTLMASHCRYEAAIILKRSCLREFALGNILQILNMVCSTKKWIVNHQSGWQPISITLIESKTE